MGSPLSGRGERAKIHAEQDLRRPTPADHPHLRSMSHARPTRPPSALRACLLLALIALALSAACDARSRGARSADAAAGAERAFAGVQARGEVAMGVDQYTSAHVFEDL